MSSSDFAHIASRTESGKADRLFRAAVVAFCALTRPTRRETAQLEDLVLPLFDAVSPASRRYVAACLADAHDAPSGLVRRLADEPVDISAPLIIRSPKLTDIDLVALIGRRGLAHARVVGRRGDLNPAIANLVRALEKQPPAARNTGDEIMPRPAVHPSAPAEPDQPASIKADRAETPAEDVRRRLRSMMLPAQATKRPISTQFPLEHVPRGAIFAKLRATALTGNAAYFQTALADALGIGFRLARAMTETEGYAELIFALKALDLDSEEAFVLAAAMFPRRFPHAEAIRLFIERYDLCHPEAARDRLRGWKLDSLAEAMDDGRGSTTAQGSNSNRPAPSSTALKAS